VSNARFLNGAVYVALIVLAGIGLAVWVGAATRIGGLLLLAVFGWLYSRVTTTSRPWRQLLAYYVAQTTIAVALLLLSGGNDASGFLLIILALQAAVMLPPRPAIGAVAGLYVVGSVGVVWRVGAAGLTNVLFSLAAFVFTAAFGQALRLAELARRRNELLLAELRAAQRQVQDLAVVEERNRLARDLHDSVKQQLFAAQMQLGAALASLVPEATAYAHVAEAERLNRQAGQELTGLIRALRPAALEHQSLPAALHALAADWSRQSGIRATVQAAGAAALPAAVEQALFRVAQEALANVARHSGAATVDIRLDGDIGRVRLTVEDDGRGFHPAAQAGGIGLASMAERMAAVGGQLQVESQGNGTRVSALYVKAETER
jgi:signal transduction histidine kinase